MEMATIDDRRTRRRAFYCVERKKGIQDFYSICERIKSNLAEAGLRVYRAGASVMRGNSLMLLLLCTGFSLIMLTTLSGCNSSSSSAMQPAGFLRDYSRLKPISKTSWRYINPEYDLGDYSKFIVDRVEMLLEAGEKSSPKDWDELEKLRDYMHTVIELSIRRPNEVVTQPGRGVARIRIALTGLKGASAAGLGTSRVSMETEILDSQTGEQIAAIVESQKKGGLVNQYSGEWRDAKQIMDEWAKRFRSRLEEARRH
jgi:hypothetical protein